MSGGPGFSEGVRICETGVVGVKNPPLTLGLGAAVAGVLAWLFVLIERFNFVGEIIPRLADCNEKNISLISFCFDSKTLKKSRQIELR